VNNNLKVMVGLEAISVRQLWPFAAGALDRVITAAIEGPATNVVSGGGRSLLPKLPGPGLAAFGAGAGRSWPGLNRQDWRAGAYPNTAIGLHRNGRRRDPSRRLAASCVHTSGHSPGKAPVRRPISRTHYWRGAVWPTATNAFAWCLVLLRRDDSVMTGSLFGLRFSASQN
jgi:hypothetical protein